MGRRLLAALLLAAAACLAMPVVSVSVSEFDSTVADFDQFAALLEVTEQQEAETNEHLEADSLESLALLEVSEGENPSYTLAYPPITYAAHAAGGFIHPFSNVNPLSAPWAGFAPVAGVAHVPTAAAVAASPLSAYYAGALHPALGINTNLFPAAFHVGGADAKGGYNVHGLNAGNVFGGYHPGLANDLTSLGGKAGAGGEEAAGFLETETHSELEAEAEAEADIDADIASLVETGADDTETQFLEVAEDGEEEGGGEEAAAEGGEEGGEEAAAGGGGGGEGGANPSYTLPYPPVLPGHYSPLFNPYTNVNPLSTPFANYAAQPGGHPAVAAAAAAQAGGLAAINGQIAGAAGGYPYYPFAGTAAVHAAAVPFSGYGGWIHPQNLNSASVGENEGAASLGQFIEVATQEVEHGECVGCAYD